MLAAVLVSGPTSSAECAERCSCRPPEGRGLTHEQGVGESLRRATVVFRGHVVRADPVPSAVPGVVSKDFGSPVGRARLAVTAVWKGEVGDTAVMALRSGNSCDIWMREGEEFVVFATRLQDGSLYTMQCTGTVRIERAGSTLMALGEPAWRLSSASARPDTVDVMEAVWRAAIAMHPSRRVTSLHLPAANTAALTVSPGVRDALVRRGVRVSPLVRAGHDTVVYHVRRWSQDSTGAPMLEMVWRWTTLSTSGNGQCSAVTNVATFRAELASSGWSARLAGPVMHGDGFCAPVSRRFVQLAGCYRLEIGAWTVTGQGMGLLPPTEVRLDTLPSTWQFAEGEVRRAAPEVVRTASPKVIRTRHTPGMWYPVGGDSLRIEWNTGFGTAGYWLAVRGDSMVGTATTHSDMRVISPATRRPFDNPTAPVAGARVACGG